VNPPFASVRIPSIALTQLKRVTQDTFGDAVEVRAFDLNHAFAKYFGEAEYEELINSHKHFVTGLGDWIFRATAFPENPDNTREYFARYYPRPDPTSRLTRDFILEKRAGVRDVFRRFIETHGLASSDLLGLSTMFSQNTACFAFARVLKEINPDVCAVLGGANCEYPMGLEIVRNVDVIDYVFSGPGLVNFPDFVGRRLRGEPEPSSVVEGLLTKDNADAVAASGKPSIGTALDINVRTPLNYDGFLDSYEQHFPDGEQPALLFETSRGCWWGEKSHCTFCGLNGLSMTYRAMDAALAIEQFEEIFAYAARGVAEFQCVDNILPKSYLRDVLPLIDPPEGSHLFYEVKADLSEDDVRTLARARVFKIQPGIEALSSSTLKLMKKGVTAFQNIALLKNCSMYGIRPAWNLLVGFPGEPASVFEKYTKDVPLLTHLEPPGGVAVVRFDRFSPYFNQAKSYELDLRPYDFYNLVYPFSKESIQRLAFYFTDNNYEADYFIGMMTWLKQMNTEVGKWRERWSHGSAQRPRLELREEAGVEYVFDSRGAVPVRWDLTQAGLRILKHLRTQTTMDRLESALTDMSAEAVRAELAALRSMRLIFDEGERLMSVVIEETAAAREFRHHATGASMVTA
jgi:magnesium-protoporphyrin IX monomethyl ester (oxidative) cyclase